MKVQDTDSNGKPSSVEGKPVPLRKFKRSAISTAVASDSKTNPILCTRKKVSPIVAPSSAAVPFKLELVTPKKCSNDEGLPVVTGKRKKGGDENPPDDKVQPLCQELNEDFASWLAAYHPIPNNVVHLEPNGPERGKQAWLAQKAHIHSLRSRSGRKADPLPKVWSRGVPVSKWAGRPPSVDGLFSSSKTTANKLGQYIVDLETFGTIKSLLGKFILINPLQEASTLECLSQNEIDAFKGRAKQESATAFKSFPDNQYLFVNLPYLASVSRGHPSTSVKPSSTAKLQPKTELSPTVSEVSSTMTLPILLDQSVGETPDKVRYRNWFKSKRKLKSVLKCPLVRLKHHMWKVPAAVSSTVYLHEELPSQEYNRLDEQDHLDRWFLCIDEERQQVVPELCEVFTTAPALERRSSVDTPADVRWGAACMWWNRYFEGKTPKEVLDQKLAKLWDSAFEYSVVRLETEDECMGRLLATPTPLERSKALLDDWAEGLEDEFDEPTVGEVVGSASATRVHRATSSLQSVYEDIRLERSKNRPHHLILKRGWKGLANVMKTVPVVSTGHTSSKSANEAG